MIRLEGVSKRYDDKVAVEDVDLDVEAGSLFGLIGPNGAGKTTTLKMLATLIKPDEGTIEIDGLDAERDVREIRRTIGYMPDAFGVFRGLTCEDYLLFFGRSYGLWGRELRSRLDDVLALTELGGLRDEATQALSTGMKQRLSIAKTLLHDPSTLLLDEPASGLDPRARIEIRSLLKELSKMGKTVLISSHILADLEEICSDIAIIERGRVVWQGPLETALDARTDGLLQVKLRVRRDDAERTHERVRELEFVRDATLQGPGEILVEIDGGRPNRLLAALLDADIEVVSYSREGTSLETIFLERTKGLVS